MDASLLDRARAGDEDAFKALTAPFRRELHLHCYRMLGSLTDADDLLQETMLAAWRGLAAFAGRSSVRTWLYAIATNRCLNEIRATKRRPPVAPVPPFVPPEPTRHRDVTWLQPYPDAELGPAPGPEARICSTEAIRLGFVAALQALPARQTAALVLCDVLAFPPREVAAMLGTSPNAVKGLLQRARASLARGAPRRGDGAVSSAAEQQLAQRFADAYGHDDVDAVVALLTDEAWLSMPPATHEYHGRRAVAGFLRASVAGRSGRRLLLGPTRANGQPAFTCSLENDGGSGPRPTGVVVLTLAHDGVAGISRFLVPDLTERFSAPSR